MAVLDTEWWDKAPVGSFCGPDAYDYQYNRYCQHIMNEEATNTIGAGARGPSKIAEERNHCCDRHGREASYILIIIIFIFTITILYMYII